MSEPTTGDLFKAKTVTDDEVAAAVDVFMRDATVSLFKFASGHTLNPAAAVRSHAWASMTITTVGAAEHMKRASVRTAIVLARPKKR